MVTSLAEAEKPNVPPEVFLTHYQAIRNARRAHEDTSMALARCKKAAKGAGLDLDAFRLLENLSKLEEDEAEIQLRHLHQYAVWANLPIGTQLDAFGQHQVPKPKAKALTEHDLWKASDAGYRSGRAGRPRDDNPHPLGSEIHVNWANGWIDGQRQIANEINGAASKQSGSTEKAAAPTSRSRGREPGSRNGRGTSPPLN